MFLRALAALALLLLASCGSIGGGNVLGIKPYRIEIQQGNFVSQEMVSQLKPGMSKDQVRFILGTPLIMDSFHADRWDYVFRRQRVNSTALEHRRIAVLFEDGKLKRIEGDVKAAGSADAGGTGSTAAASPGAKPVEPAPAAQAAAEAAKPAAAADPAAAPAQGAAPEKSWWQKLKDMF